jgi:hypothetical protein
MNITLESYGKSKKSKGRKFNFLIYCYESTKKLEG